MCFSNLNAEIKTSALTIIKGKNGSGKSTLLRTIAGLTPIEGRNQKNGIIFLLIKNNGLEN